MLTTSDGLTETEVKFFNAALVWAVRGLRGLVYFLVSAMLIWVNTYGLSSGLVVALVIGALGVGAVTARLSLAAVAILLIMAVLPLQVVQSIASVF